MLARSLMLVRSMPRQQKGGEPVPRCRPDLRCHEIADCRGLPKDLTVRAKPTQPPSPHSSRPTVAPPPLEMSALGRVEGARKSAIDGLRGLVPAIKPQQQGAARGVIEGVARELAGIGQLIESRGDH